MQRERPYSERVIRENGDKAIDLHGWSTGRSPHKLADLKIISRYLEISLHELIFGEDERGLKTGEVIIIEGNVEVVIRRKS